MQQREGGGLQSLVLESFRGSGDQSFPTAMILTNPLLLLHLYGRQLRASNEDHGSVGVVIYVVEPVAIQSLGYETIATGCENVSDARVTRDRHMHPCMRVRACVRS